MKNFTVITLLLLHSLSWICVSVSEFDTVEVQSGQQVTLMCSNFSSSPTQITWFRVVKRLKPHCICFFFKSSDPAKFCDGFKNGRFEATSNSSTFFLTIRQVDLSDTGLYFCGYHLNQNPVIVSATYLEVPNGLVKPMAVTLGGLIVFLAMVFIGLVGKVKQLQKETHIHKTPPLSTTSPAHDLSDMRSYCRETIRCTMSSVTWVSALLLCCWISVSGTVDVQPGHNVTLQCSNILTQSPTHKFWSRLINRTRVDCISSMYGSEPNAKFCDRIQKGKYEMRFNISTVFLTIKKVDVSDSGLYFCGFYKDSHTILQVVDLDVQGNDEPIHDDTMFQKEPDVFPKLMSVILGAVTVFLVLIIIVLAVKYRKLQKVTDEKQNLQRNENLDCDDLKAAALTLYSATTVRSRRPEAERQVDTHAVYSASR
ncbi:uncharacterized protein [Channa argus]|uniref:uncharacterized protein n=1 Tax=Channa argus TaxID=215402 RepID=UPI00351FD50E